MFETVSSLCFITTDSSTVSYKRKPLDAPQAIFLGRGGEPAEAGVGAAAAALEVQAQRRRVDHLSYLFTLPYTERSAQPALTLWVQLESILILLHRLRLRRATARLARLPL